ncbi:SYNE1 isoform 13, partial [Pan troglodytes]
FQHSVLSTSTQLLFKDLLQNTDAHKRAFHEIYRTRSVNGIPVPPDQLEDMAERVKAEVLDH